MEKGWIKLHRRIQEHPFFLEKRSFSKFEAWIDLLLMVNHKENKFLLGNEIIELKPGQKVTSIRQLGERWGWSKTKVTQFLKLLQTEGMLTYKSDTKKTVITIEKYSDYQHEKDMKETRNRHEGDTEQTRESTNKNVKNDNNDKNENNRDIYKELEIIVNFYERNITPQIAPNTLNEMKFLVEDYDPYLIIEAYKIAISKNIRHKESYIKPILSNWLQDGIEKPSQLQQKGAKPNAKSSRSKPEHHPLDDLF